MEEARKPNVDSGAVQILEFAARPSVPIWECYQLVLVPPSPVGLQNLENKGLILRLCARSLSSKELHAKSREHWSYAGGGCSVLGAGASF